jgi:hypothetical protein
MWMMMTSSSLMTLIMKQASSSLLQALRVAAGIAVAGTLTAAIPGAGRS